MATKDTDLNFLHILSTYDFILYKLNDFLFTHYYSMINSAILR